MFYRIKPAPTLSDAAFEQNDTFEVNRRPMLADT